ncbi:MAG: hypothetical protein IH848_00780 [Acidobacteria bacterium]|nr:hypothetical protein [Acidobacteriota bacterium]
MATTTKNTKKTTTKKKASAKKNDKPKEDLVVFAFRLTEAERTAIHQTAGPANASRFIRRVAVAFANEDEYAFKAVLAEARELRG